MVTLSTVIGVTPLSKESTNIWAPGGEELTAILPKADTAEGRNSIINTPNTKREIFFMSDFLNIQPSENYYTSSFDKF